MAINRDEFRAVLGRFASGVTVVTTFCDGKPHGLTVSAFSSLSLDPPLILVCLDSKSAGHQALTRSGVFAVNFLADDQEMVSQRFASKVPDKFTGIAYHNGLAGAPVIEGTLASVECRLVSTYEGGDHTIFVGEIEQATVGNATPLLYYRGTYRRLAV